MVAYTETLISLAVYRQQLAPIADGLISMSISDKLHSQCRVPGRSMDSLARHMPSRHVVVICNGHVYAVDVFDESRRVYSLEQLYQIFVDILRRPGGDPADPASKISALTFDRRDQWAGNRKKFFLNNAVNEEALKLIETAVIALTFDDADDYGYDPERPEILDRFTKEMLTGNGCNRWADKCKNYVVSKNGRLGCTAVHSPADWFEFSHAEEICSFVETQVQRHPPDVKDIEDVANWQPPADLKLAKQLEFEVAPEMAQEIKRCYADYQPIKENIDVAAFVFTEFGSGRIEFKFSCSPDAFVQMALQLAYYKLHARFVLTSEPASTKFYRNSRTEPLRTVSNHSCAFVRSMQDEGILDTERIRLLHKACETHTRNGLEAMTGKGVDRHLLVLYGLSRAKHEAYEVHTRFGTIRMGYHCEGIPSPFLEHFISRKWALTTSQAPVMRSLVDEDADLNAAWLGGSIVPADPDGYGVSYRFAGNHSIPFTITSMRSCEETDSNRFRAALKDSLREMATLFEINTLFI